MNRWTILFTVMLAVSFFTGCATTTPDPVIVTKTVEKAVPTPCKPTLPPRPALMTLEQIRAALAEAPTVDDQVKIITGQLILYAGWTPTIEGALSGCATVPPG